MCCSYIKKVAAANQWWSDLPRSTFLIPDPIPIRFFHPRSRSRSRSGQIAPIPIKSNNFADPLMQFACPALDGSRRGKLHFKKMLEIFRWSGISKFQWLVGWFVRGRFQPLAHCLNLRFIVVRIHCKFAKQIIAGRGVCAEEDAKQSIQCLFCVVVIDWLLIDCRQWQHMHRR